MMKLTWLVAATVAIVPDTSAAQDVRYIDPVGGFTQVVTVTDRGVKTVFVSGQVGQGDDYRAQVESAFASIVRRLEQAGALICMGRWRRYAGGPSPRGRGPPARWSVSKL